jgi:hypothetical protein
MIGHELHRSGSFWSFLLSIDKDLADSTRQNGCSCGGRLHSASYPQAPRDGPDHLPEEYRSRFSFCCDRDGCRKMYMNCKVRARLVLRRNCFGVVGPTRARSWLPSQSLGNNTHP